MLDCDWSSDVCSSDLPDFVNAVAGLLTRLSPRALMTALLDIESHHGRDRAFKNAPRTLDLDLLLYDGLAMHEPGLTLPHPRMIERAFVLLPLAEIAPDALIPGHGRVDACLARLSTGNILRLATPAGVAVS
jgi:2-amino-4-hydroxy-6-hydroxymethyldihydropteridine diphosphokinase